ncbi:GGDEF domain-containing protein [Serratia sp. MYb239]|uniref:GGDEF domain-containing protein n=1 Tax=Serratia sp. MYb239 TaxID=2033438 RepID=UPI001F30910E|nr:GGDEF domain-containing protein [Serratia sp. MYb239]
MGKENKRRQPGVLAHRDDMVNQAICSSLPWLASINIAFAMLVVLRNLLFPGFDATLHIGAVIPFIMDGMMATVVTLSLILWGVSRIGKGGDGRRVRLWALLLLPLLGVLWAISCFGFVAYWQLPFAWPLVCILMLTGMTSLYFYPPGFALFLTPLWLITPLASIQLNHGVNGHFAVIWLIFTVIVIYGRQTLLRWFDEAWSRYQENQLLISRLETLALQDPLTGLANRRALESHLASLCAVQVPFALIMVDVDYFKHYNDRYGHQAGDACLTDVAALLAAAVRTPEDLVARYGGEEFTLVLAHANAEQAAQVAERIRARIEQAALPHAASAVSRLVTVSLGIAASAGRLTPPQMIAEADEALYRAKQAGRDRWSY